MGKPPRAWLINCLLYGALLFAVREAYDDIIGKKKCNKKKLLLNLRTGWFSFWFAFPKNHRFAELYIHGSGYYDRSSTVGQVPVELDK